VFGSATAAPRQAPGRGVGGCRRRLQAAAAGGGCRRRLDRARRLAPGTGRQAAALPPKAYKQAVMHQMLNTTTIMLTSKWLIHSLYKRFRQKV